MGLVLDFNCPRCNYGMDVATAIDGSGVHPSPGDLTVCIMCGAPMEWSSEGSPRWLTLDEFMTLPEDAIGAIARVVTAIAMQRPSGVMFDAEWKRKGTDLWERTKSNG